MPIAITREVSRSLGACELSYVDRAAIDVERAHIRRVRHGADRLGLHPNTLRSRIKKLGIRRTARLSQA